MQYVDKAKIEKKLKSAKTRIISGIICMLLFIPVILSIVQGDADAKTAGYMGSYIVFELIGAALILSGIKPYIMRDRATKLGQIFAADADGFLSVEELVIPLGARNTIQACKRIDELIAKGFIINCTVEYSPSVRVVLSRPDKGSVGTESVVCPKCGAPGKRHAGFVYVCPYCGNVVSDK